MSLTISGFVSEIRPTKPGPFRLGPEGMLLYYSNAFGGEAGEVQNIVKKIIRDGETSELTDALVEEAGAALFYLQMLLNRRGFSLEDAALALLDKLERQRQEAR